MVWLQSQTLGPCEVSRSGFSHVDKAGPELTDWAVMKKDLQTCHRCKRHR